jgi:PhzF family phenazine biosynthesis protein
MEVIQSGHSLARMACESGWGSLTAIRRDRRRLSSTSQPAAISICKKVGDADTVSVVNPNKVSIMLTIGYRLVNAFAKNAFEGNTLALVEGASTLSSAEMQLITRQFNLSETSFILTSAHAAARIRIFTPTYATPFAGHPTLGFAHVVYNLPHAGVRFSLEMEAGIIPAHCRGRRWHLTAHRPCYRSMEAGHAELAAMLNLPVDDTAGPGMWVDCGTEQPIIPLPRRHARPRISARSPVGGTVQHQSQTRARPTCFPARQKVSMSDISGCRTRPASVRIQERGRRVPIWVAGGCTSREPGRCMP